MPFLIVRRRVPESLSSKMPPGGMASLGTYSNCGEAFSLAPQTGAPGLIAVAGSELPLIAPPLHAARISDVAITSGAAFAAREWNVLYSLLFYGQGDGLGGLFAISIVTIWAAGSGIWLPLAIAV